MLAPDTADLENLITTSLASFDRRDHAEILAATLTGLAGQVVGVGSVHRAMAAVQKEILRETPILPDMTGYGSRNKGKAFHRYFGPHAGVAYK